MKNLYFNSIVKKLKQTVVLLAILFGFSTTINAQVRKAFTQRTSQFSPTKKVYNVKGDFTMLGNTCLTLQNYRDDRNNNNQTMVYVDTDNDATTFNSSSSTLEIPSENGSTPSCSNIVYAGLYWTGKGSSSLTFNVTKNSVTKTFDKRIVKLKGPSASSYTTFTAATGDIYYPSGTEDDIYSGYVEVTSYVRQYGLGNYTLADMALLEGGSTNGTGFSGGWGMIVIYENSKMKWRDVTIFDGYAYVEAGNSSAGIELPVSGFNTVQTGNVGMKIGFMASEGDVGFTGDYFKIRNLNTANYTTLSRSSNGVVPNPDNFFNSSITAPGNRNPNLNNNTGIDIGIVNIPNTGNTIIGNSQTSTKFLYGTNGDTYSIFNIAMSVDAYIPEAEATLTTTTINNQPAVLPYTILPNQEAGFTIDVRNLGTEAINNYKVIVPIPYNATYVNGSATGTLFYTTPNPTTITGTFDPNLGATGSIVWNFGTLPLPSNPATLLARLTFKLKATNNCEILSNSSCASAIPVNGNFTGVGATTNVALSSALIQGYTVNGNCVGQVIPTPINIGINGAAYVQQNCPGTDYTRHFSYCSASTTVAPSEIASNFPAGSLFYNSFPVTVNSIQFTDANPFPLVAGSTVTYYAVPAGGGSGCNFPFTITKCPVIVAQNDALTGGNGTVGNPNAGNVLNNNGSGADTLNGVQALISQVNITVTTPATSIGGNPVPVIDTNTGQVSVPVGTPAGTYTIVYNLCEKLNPTTNCDPATVTITVTAPAIVAQNDTISGGNGTTGNPNAGNVLNNNGNGPDTLNGNPATISQVNITITSPASSIGGAPVPTIDTATGQISVPTGTPAGTYTIVYNLCEKLNPTNCDPATVIITVTAPAIVAQDDTLSGGNGATGNPNAGNVLNNNGNGPDTLNGNPATISQVNITVTTPATSIGGAPVPVLATATGQVSVPIGTPAGTYTIAYNLCEKLNPTNCDPATVTITVTAPAIVAQDDTLSGGNGTTGNPNAGNVLSNNGNGPDTLNGIPVSIAQVNISVTTPATSIGGAPVPVLATATGQVSVPAGTPAGTYTIVYNLCEKLNPTNCDPATVTINVLPALIIAQDDLLSGGNGFVGNPNAGNVLNNNNFGNDILNGSNAVISLVNISVTTPATSIGGAPVPTLATATGQVSVPAGTPAGTYTIVYNLCEKLNPSNCDPATVTITVTAAQIIANDDAGTPVNGLTGGTSFTNVLVNDTLNGVPVLASQVNISQISTTNPGVTLVGTDVVVAPGTPAGSYTLVYQICEILNPTNCDTATVTVSVTPAQIIANDDAGTPVNGLTGGTAFTNVLVNDTLNGVPVLASQVNISQISTTNPGVTLVGTDVVVAPGTPAGSYTLVYQICEILNPTNCDTATVTVSVTPAQIIANDDAGTPVNGLTGGTSFTNVLVNDTLNGVPVLASQVNISQISTTNPGVTLVGTDVVVAPGTPAGSYTLVYQICEILNPTNCDTATVTVSVTPAQIIANDDAGTPVNGLTGGTSFTNVLVNDTLNGVPVLASQVNISQISTTNPGVTLVGTDVVVAPGTPAGSYTLVYQICEILNPTNCDTATVTVSVTPAQIIANDDAGTPVNGLTGGTSFTNVLVNDTLNGVPVLASQVNISQISTTNPGVTLVGTDVVVAPGTPAGSYTLVYQICEILNPTNCDTATVTVSVTPAQIIANDDAGTPVNGLTGGTSFTNVLVNDTLNGVPVLASQVNISQISTTNPGVTLVGTDVVVAPGTPAGSYTLVYQICEILNPTNCDTATVTVSVTPAQIIANDDAGTPVNGLTGGTSFTNVLVNDTLNGVPVLASQVNISQISTTNPGVTLVGTDVVVAPGTPAGSYTLVYQICEILNPTNCDTATVTVSVTPAQIIANDDAGTPVNGLTGGTSFTNVLVNDTLNGVPVLASQVNISQISTTNPGVTLVGTDVVVAPGTPAGSYTLVYQICEILNPTNCDTATVTVSVTPAQIIANDDAGTPVNGLTGGTSFTNVLVNDTLNGVPVLASQVNISQISTTNPGVTLVGTDVVVAPGTPAGSYTLVYQICEILNPTNCDTATVTVSVTPAQIIANDDAGTPVNGLTGGTSFTNVLVNDTLNGVPVLASQVNISQISTTNPGVTLVGTDVVVAPGTPAGSYTLVYQICEILNPTNCDTATVTVSVTPAQIIANDDAGTPVNGLTGGTAFTNVLVNDTLNGVPVLASQVNISQISTTNPGVTLVGTDVVVAPGTPAGSYTLVYQICEILNPTNCDTATVTVSVTPAQIIANDDAGTPVNGLTGGTSFTNVLVNDTLNGVPVLASQVNISQISTTNPGVTLVGTDVVVAPGTPAGSYTLVYQICEILNPTNCDTATVTVSVTPAQIIANDDAGTPVNGLTGGTAFTNVLVNDTLNGVPVLASQVNISQISTTNPGVTLVGTDVVVAPGTPAGSYTLVYQICEILNPTNCDTATVTVSVGAASIEAIDDNYLNIQCSNVGLIGNILTNDTLNTTIGLNTNQVNLTLLSGTYDNLNIDANGNINLTSIGSCGSYTFTYRICEILNPNNCDEATVTVVIQDLIAPTFTAPANTEIFTTADCTFDASVAATGDVTNEADNCSSELQATFTDSVADGQCAGSKIITRTWTLVDACGNAAAPQTQTITVTDNIAPTFTAPANTEIFTTADCTFDASVAATGDVTNEADNCSTNLQATFTDSVADGACAGSKIITRTWTLVDACGNAAAPQTQTITVTDNIAPTFAAPANTEIFTTADCTFDASVAATGDVTNEADNCSTNLQATFTDSVADGACAGSKIITRTWTLVDACGNAAAPQTQTITVTDNIAPTFTAPANTEIFTTADCTFDASVAATGDVTNEADNCSSELQATFTDSVADGQCAGSKIITRTWTLVDACGNAAAPQTQTITVTDNIAPTFTAPANTEIFTTADCTFDASVAATGDVTNEADNCSSELQATFTDSVADGACAGSKIITRTWTLVDACGNAAAPQTQTITVTDNIAPTFTAPANTEIFTTADCTFDASVAATGDVTNEADNCSSELQATFTDSVADGQCAGSKIITRTWTLVDACGNAAAPQTQTITVTDNIAPTFTAPANTEIFTTADCTFDASVAATGDVTNEADNCSSELQATFTDSVADGACAGSKIITRTWTLVDACGNAAAPQTQTITVTDNIAPTFTAQASNILVECNGQGNEDELTAWLNNHGGAVASDNCSNVTWSNNFNAIANDCSAAVTVIFTATDECNNSSTTSATFTIHDTVAPTFTAPANTEIFTTADCTFDASVTATGDVTNEADNCSSELQATFTDSIADGACAGSKIITRTWTLVDACGNAAAPQTQTITVTDNIAPTFTAPANTEIFTTADCTFDASVAATGDVTNEADNCSSELQATFTDSVADGACAGSKIITRTWTLVDACGNAAAPQTQTITVTDNIAPTFTAPANTEIFTTADCTFDASVAATGDVTNEADNCSSELQATFTDSVADGQCAGSKIITRTWTLVDACGNAAAPQTQTITVTDNIAPTFTAPANTEIFTTADCTFDASVAATGDVTNEADNCSSELQATFTDSVADGACAGSKIITRTWTLVDACGNAAAPQTQTITVTDNIAPTFTAPANTEIFTTADCTFDASVAATGDVTNEADNCSSELQATFTDSVADGQCAGSKIITRTWTLVDACGNAAAPQTQTITVTDNIAPTFTAPANTEIFTTADCTFDASVAATGDVTNEADNCSSELQATFTDSVADGACAGSKIITRTWTLVDACGNAAAPQTQTITVTDNIAPTFAAPANTEIFTTADCTFDASVAATGDVTNEADNCSSELQATFTDSVADGACAGSKIITRTWTLVDACGNAAAPQTQTITVTDNIAPTFTAPANTEIFTTADCTFDASVAATGDVTNEADNCSSELQATFTDSVADGACAGSKIITRTWALVDACGNAAAPQTQTITVSDNIAPIVPQAPASIAATCSGEVPAMIALTAMDNCSGAISVMGEDSVAPGSCPNSFTVTRTWTFVDGCGNTSSVSQTISVNDNIPPTFSQAAPANTTASCDNIPAPAVLTAIDNCGVATVNMTETILAGTCPANYQIVRSWIATDACGNNSAPVSQTITVSDNSGPTPIVPIPATLEVTCDLVPVAPVLTLADFTDNCSSVVGLAFTQTQTQPVNGTYTITRIWMVSDACGNVRPTTQIITVTQTTDVTTVPASSCTNEDIAYNLRNLLTNPNDVPVDAVWTNVDGVGGFTGGNSFNANGITPGVYTFSYTITTGLCPRRIEIKMTVNTDCGVLPCATIVIHNAFSPNNDIDQLNEYFSIEHIEDFDCYPTNSVEIYNRWGVLVYETKQYDNNTRKFVGKSEGRATVSKAEELPTGTYFYIIQWTTTDGQTVNKDGYLYLTR